MRALSNRELLLGVVVAGALNVVIGLGALIHSSGQEQALKDLRDRIDHLEKELLPKISQSIQVERRSELKEVRGKFASFVGGTESRLENLERVIAPIGDRMDALVLAGESWVQDLSWVKKAVRRLAVLERIPDRVSEAGEKGQP